MEKYWFEKNIKDYEFVLSNLDLVNKLDNRNPTHTINVGIHIKDFNIEMIENKMYVPFFTEIVGVNDGMTFPKIGDTIDDENILFHINIGYTVKLITDLSNKDKNLDLNDLKEFALYILRPTLNETLSYIGNKIGLPQLKVPKNISLNKNGD